MSCHGIPMRSHARSGPTECAVHRVIASPPDALALARTDAVGRDRWGRRSGTPPGRCRRAPLCVALCAGLVASWAAPVALAADGAGQVPTVTLKSGRSYHVYGDLLVPVEAPPGIQGALAGTRWSHATVNYAFDGSITASQRSDFRNWANQWETGSGVRFVEDAAAPNRVLVQRAVDVGCGHSSLGMIGGVQDLVIANDNNCWASRVVNHELGHVLGAIHEQQRTDRGSFVTIVDHGIVAQCGQGTWDANYAPVFTQTSTAYDYASIMHYPGSAHYTCNNTDVWATITVLQAQPWGWPPGSENACTSVAACQGIIGISPVSQRDRGAMALRYGYRYRVTLVGNGSGSYQANGWADTCGSDCYLVPMPNGISHFSVVAQPAAGSVASFAGACTGHTCVVDPDDNGDIIIRFTRKASIAAVVTALGRKTGDRIFASGFEAPQ